MKNKIAAQILAFREKNRIKQAIKQYDGLVDLVIVACSSKPWMGNLEKDNSYELAIEASSEMETPVWVFEDYWKTEADQRNFCMETALKAGIDWVLIAPPDRFFTRETLETLRHFIQTAEKISYAMYTLTYWRNYDTVILPDQVLNEALIPVINKDNIPFKFSYANTSGGGENPLCPGIAHHISWVKTDSEIKDKIKSYTHANEIITNWYEDVWLKWDKNMTDFSPTEAYRGSGGIDYKSVALYPIPEEIRKRLCE